jgi:hypothetical protein
LSFYFVRNLRRSHDGFIGEQVPDHLLGQRWMAMCLELGSRRIAGRISDLDDGFLDDCLEP